MKANEPLSTALTLPCQQPPLSPLSAGSQMSSFKLSQEKEKGNTRGAELQTPHPSLSSTAVYQSKPRGDNWLNVLG